MKLPAFPAIVTAPVLAAAMLAPQPASAFNLPTSQCLNYLAPVSAQTLMALPERSKLEIMRTQQETGLIPSIPAIASTGVAMPPVAPVCPHGTSGLAALHPPVAPQPQQLLPVTDRPDVFGSVALPVSSTPLDAKWRAADNARLSKRAGAWSSVVWSASGMSRAEKLQTVNRWVNAHVRFTDDRPGKRGADRWAGAAETLQRGKGDCEDYAIAKMKLLEAAGIARDDMYLVIARDLVRRADHALLVVRLDERLVALDNSTDQLLDAQDASDYRPIFSYGAHGKWIHGYAEQPVRIAAAF